MYTPCIYEEDTHKTQVTPKRQATTLNIFCS